MKKKDSFIGQRMAVFPKKVIELLEKSPLTQNLYVTDAGFFPNAKYHYIERNNGSLQHIIIICTEGKGTIICEGVSTNLSAQEYYIIPKNVAHTYYADEQKAWTIYWMHFDGINAQDWIKDMSKKAMPLNILQTSLRDNTLKMIDEMYVTLEDSFSINSLGYCCVLFSYLLGLLKFSKQHIPSQVSSQQERIQESIRYMKANLNRKIALQEIANLVQLSLSHFCLLFKQETSHSPIEYLIMLRIQQACVLLTSTQLKVKEVSLEVGFDDPFYFSRVFTKAMGQSPKVYRKSFAADKKAF